VVTCASTQICVGISIALADAVDQVQIASTSATLSVAGLTPITASPLPYESRQDAGGDALQIVGG
jgi:hypothetical protein